MTVANVPVPSGAPTTFKQAPRCSSARPPSYSPYLTPMLAAKTIQIYSLIETGVVHVPSRFCSGEVRLSQDAMPPSATTLPSEDGTELYFVRVCVMDHETQAPICALYCLNVHRVFLREGAACQGGGGRVVDLSPTAFEVLGGRAGNRKWRVSLRVVDTRDGVLVVSVGLGKWLERVGLEAVLPEAATSRMASRHGSRDQTPAGSPEKMKPCVGGEMTPGGAVVTSGEILWQYCSMIGVWASSKTGEAQEEEGEEEEEKGEAASEEEKGEAASEEESEEALIYVPSTAQSRSD